MLLSVIIPVFQTKDSLDKCLSSIIDNKVTELEIVIVNDSEQDLDDRLTQKFKNTNIKIVNHFVNKSLFQARKTGFKFSEGDYILNIDSDDWLSFNVLSNYIDEIIKYKPDVYEFNYSLSYKSGNKFKLKKSNYINNFKTNKIHTGMYLQEVLKNEISHRIWNKIIKRDIYSRAFDGIEEDKYINVAEDFIIISNVFNQKIKYMYNNNPGYIYYQNCNSLTNRKFSYEELILRLKEDLFAINHLERLCIINNFNKVILNDLKSRISAVIINNSKDFSLDEKKNIAKKLTKNFGYIPLYSQILNSQYTIESKKMKTIILLYRKILEKISFGKY